MGYIGLALENDSLYILGFTNSYSDTCELVSKYKVRKILYINKDLPEDIHTWLRENGYTWIDAANIVIKIGNTINQI